MTPSDPLLERLWELPVEPLDPVLSRRIQVAALQVLRPRPVHPVWVVAIVASVVCYLGWAFIFTTALSNG